MHLLWWIIVGLIAGWATGKIMRGSGYGPLMDIVIGIVGAGHARSGIALAQRRRHGWRCDPRRRHFDLGVPSCDGKWTTERKRRASQGGLMHFPLASGESPAR